MCGCERPFDSKRSQTEGGRAVEPWQLGASEVVAAVAARELGAVELVTSLLDRIASLDPGLHVWATVDGDRALTRARALDARAGTQPGPLAGLPVGLKDVILTAGLRTTASSKALADFVPDASATVVTQLEAADAIVLGKLETCEFACGDPSVVVNPWDGSRTPGGSSSGSAVAVALGMVPSSLGTQTGGSTLRPAAYNGVVGFMPTLGAISNRDVIPLAWTMDHIGLYGRSVADVELLLGPLDAYDAADPSSLPRPPGVETRRARPDVHRPSIGLVRSRHLDTASPENAAQVDATATLLAAAGAEVREVALDDVLEPMLPISATIMTAEAAWQHEERFAARGELYGPVIAGMVERGLALPVTAYVQAQRDRVLATRALEARVVVAGVDVLLMPTAPSIAPADLTTTGDASYLVPWTTAGLPAISLPTGLSPEGMPTAVQLVGRRWGDWSLLSSARWAEAAIGFDARPPQWS